MLTAGHCLADTGLSATWYHHGSAIGKGYTHGYFEGSMADAGAIMWSESGARNRVYASSKSDIRNITGSRSNSAQAVGVAVCRSGQTSGWKCGQITATEVSTRVDGVLILHTWWTDFTSAGGDSKGAMMNNGTLAMGVASAMTSSQTVYSTIAYTQQGIGVRPCYTATC